MLKNETNKGYQKRDRMSWDDFFMHLAFTVSERTTCIYYRAGSVFVDENHRIISVGYNGPSSGDLHCIEIGCAKVHGDPITGKLKRCRGAHGEINAIINSGDTNRLRGSTLYVTLFPCYDCMKALNNVGIKRIVYYDEYLRIIDGSNGRVKEGEPEAWELARARGITIDKYDKQNLDRNGQYTGDRTRKTNNKKPESNSRW